ARAWGGVNAERGTLPPALAEAVVAGDLRAYLGHAPGRAPLYLEREQVAAARDADGRLGPRPGALFDLQTWTDLRELALDHAGRSAAERGAWDFVSLGDELSFAPWGDPLEFAPNPAMQASFDRWRRDRGRSTWPLERATWRRALSTAAPADLAAFVDRRRFEREWFTARVGQLAEELRAQGVGDLGVLGLYGSPPFGGLAIDALIAPASGSPLEVSEPYPEGLARRRVASVPPAGHRWLTTLFLDAEDPLRDPCVELWRTWAEGCDGYVIWNADRVRPPTARSKALLAELEALRALSGAGRWEWTGPEQVALLVDDDQLAFEWLAEARRRPAEGERRLGGWYEEHGRGPRLRRAWITALERIGLQPGVLRPEGLRSAPGFVHLLAIEQTWLGASQATAVEQHLAAGGHLWLRGALGALDEGGLRRETSLGERWSAAYPDQVHRLDALTADRLSPTDRASLMRALKRTNAASDSLSIERPHGWWVRRGWRTWQGARRPVACLFKGETEARALDASDLEAARASGWTTLHGPTDGVWVLQGPTQQR
ncbi:MAG: hypothetical protein ACYS26_20780, partial [Planctomycetota bacterium]